MMFGNSSWRKVLCSYTGACMNVLVRVLAYGDFLASSSLFKRAESHLT